MLETERGEELSLWETKRDLAKQERWKIRWMKPKLGKLERSAPRPMVEGGDNVDGVVDEEINGNDNGNDTDSDGVNAECS